MSHAWSSSSGSPSTPDIGAFGPFPDMYEPAWYPLKTLSAVAELLAAAAALFLLVRPKGGPSWAH